jgi:hypothetical protein
VDGLSVEPGEQNGPPGGRQEDLRGAVCLGDDGGQVNHLSISPEAMDDKIKHPYGHHQPSSDWSWPGGDHEDDPPPARPAVSKHGEVSLHQMQHG